MKNKQMSHRPAVESRGARAAMFAAYFVVSSVVLAVLWFVTSWPLIFTVQAYKIRFKDHGVTISSAAKFVIRVSEWYADDWGWAVSFLLVPVLGLLMAWRCHRVEPPAHPMRPLITWLLSAVILDILAIVIGAVIISSAANSLPAR